jgi:hypothetical protein
VVPSSRGIAPSAGATASCSSGTSHTTPSGGSDTSAEYGKLVPRAPPLLTEPMFPTTGAAVEARVRVHELDPYASPLGNPTR